MYTFVPSAWWVSGVLSLILHMHVSSRNDVQLIPWIYCCCAVSVLFKLNFIFRFFIHKHWCCRHNHNEHIFLNKSMYLYRGTFITLKCNLILMCICWMVTAAMSLYLHYIPWNKLTISLHFVLYRITQSLLDLSGTGASACLFCFQK